MPEPFAELWAATGSRHFTNDTILLYLAFTYCLLLGKWLKHSKREGLILNTIMDPQMRIVWLIVVILIFSVFQINEFQCEIVEFYSGLNSKFQQSYNIYCMGLDPVCLFFQIKKIVFFDSSSMVFVFHETTPRWNYVQVNFKWMTSK